MSADGDGDLDEVLSESHKSSSSDNAESGHMDMVTKLRGRAGNGFTTSWGPAGFEKSRHPLSIMVCVYMRWTYVL